MTDNDDEFEDLFSFDATQAEDKSEDIDKKEEQEINRTGSGDDDLFGPSPTPKARSDSADSFLDLLEDGPPADGFNVPDTDQDIMDWLDDDKKEQDDKNHKKQTEIKSSGSFDFEKDILGEDDATKEKEKETTNVEDFVENALEEATSEVETSREDKGDEQKTFGGDTIEVDSEAVGPEENVTQLPRPKESIHFDSLSEAIRSPVSTTDLVKEMISEVEYKIDQEKRPYAWSKLICGRVLGDVQNSSVADSFMEWNKTFDLDSAMQDGSLPDWIKDETYALAQKMVDISQDVNLAESSAQRSLCSLLSFHYADSGDTSEEGNQKGKVEWDPLLPAVASAILSSGVPTEAASVMLANIMPVAMPLMALEKDERWVAAKQLHTQFYLLACYHLPILVLHLDRYAPGWHWPRRSFATSSPDDETNATKIGRKLEEQGLMPFSWFVSHLVGERGGSPIAMDRLLCLWDILLTTKDSSLRFFLALTVLEKHSDTLLMLSGDDLVTELGRIMEFKEGIVVEGFLGEEEQEHAQTEESDSYSFVRTWLRRALFLSESTPESVVDKLRKAEDEAVTNVLYERQKKAEEELEARLEAEAQAHREAMELEKVKKDEEIRVNITKTRLIVFYKKYNPEKLDTVDHILEVYKGRLEVLDDRLKAKYGVGFHPALPSKISANASKLLLNMNHGLEIKKQQLGKARRRMRTKKLQEPESYSRRSHQVTLKLSPNDILPKICYVRGESEDVIDCIRRHTTESIKYYLVDSRPDDVASLQGRFPTAVSFSPEALYDPERIQKHVEMFESLRGAVHICVMGEGFDSFNSLYRHKLTDAQQELLEDDEARISTVALFFVKKGFPFVSVLDGGFAGAHAWLSREGSSVMMSPAKCLIDYEEEASLFAHLERAYQDSLAFQNASGRDKSTKAMQKLLDSSMVSLTKSKKRLEKVAADFQPVEKTQQARESIAKIFDRQGSSGGASQGANQPPAMPESHEPSDAPKVKQTSLLGNRFSKWGALAKQGATREGQVSHLEVPTPDVEETSSNVDDSAEPVAPEALQRVRGALANLIKPKSEPNNEDPTPSETAASEPATKESTPDIENDKEKETAKEKVYGRLSGLGRFGLKASSSKSEDTKGAQGQEGTSAESESMEKAKVASELMKKSFAGLRGLGSRVSPSSEADSERTSEEIEKSAKDSDDASKGENNTKRQMFAEMSQSAAAAAGAGRTALSGVMKKNPFSRFSLPVGDSDASSNAEKRKPQVKRFAGMMSHVRPQNMNFQGFKIPGAGANKGKQPNPSTEELILFNEPDDVGSGEPMDTAQDTHSELIPNTSPDAAGSDDVKPDDRNPVITDKGDGEEMPDL